jgi:hypothetical protein
VVDVATRITSHPLARHAKRQVRSDQKHERAN